MGSGDAGAALDIQAGRNESSCPLDDEYGSLRLGKSSSGTSLQWLTGESPGNTGGTREGVHDKGNTRLRRVFQGLHTFCPHRSFTGEHDSRWFCVGASPWIQAGFVASGDNVVAVREGQPGTFIPQRWIP